MEVSLATREDESYRGFAPTLGLYRRLSRYAHAHAKALHGAPYLAGCWRPPSGSSTPVLTPRLKEEPTRYCPTGGEAAQHVASVRLAAAPPAPTPLVLGYSHLLPQDPAPRYAVSPNDHYRPELGHAFSHNSSLDAAHSLDSVPSLTHSHQRQPRHTNEPSSRPNHQPPQPHTHDAVPSRGHDPATRRDHDPVTRRGHDPAPGSGHDTTVSSRGHDPAPRHRRPPGHRRQLPTTKHSALRRDPPQGYAASTLLPGVAASPDTSGRTRPSKGCKNTPSWATTNSSAPWRPDPAGGDGGSESVPSSPPAAAPLRQDALTPQDLAEIKQLQESYVGNLEDVTLPLEDPVPRGDLGRLYTCFIERRAKFLVSTPLYGTVAAADRAKLLHVSVAMSTYFTGAHHIDTSHYTWRQRRGAGPAGREVAVLAASSVRQLLSHQQFLHVMKFYTTYSEALADHTVTILMQVMSLFHPEEGLEAPRPVEEGRLHYLALLSRYLADTHGPREGARLLAKLLTSQQEARQLVELLRQVDLTPREPGAHLATSRAMLEDRIHLVCEAARSTNARRDAGDGLGGARPTTPPAHSSPEPEGGTVDHMGRIVSRLAQCDDPHTLAQARRILPQPLLHRFLRLLLHPAARQAHPTPPSPSPSPPSPQCRKSCITRHAGRPPPPGTTAPRALQHLPAASHAPELAAE